MSSSDMTDQLTALEPGSSNSLWYPEEFQMWPLPDEEMDTGENSLRGVGGGVSTSPEKNVTNTMANSLLSTLCDILLTFQD